jgi:putative membrane protein
MAFPGIQLAMHGVLLAAAFSFWMLLLCLPDARRWHALPALLLTGKLVCLLAALMVFAPRALYGTGHAPGPLTHPLDDQHLAGLLMIAGCPLSYLVAAVVITVQLLNRGHAADAASLRQPAHGTG